MIETWLAELPHGITLSCRGAGARGRPLMLFLHGFPEAAFIWDALMAHFAQPEHGGFRCVAPNLRGFEQSSAPAEVAAYKPALMVQDVLALAAAEGVDGRIHTLVAHDWGGAFAWAAANAHPARIDHLVILNSPHPATFARELLIPQLPDFYRQWPDIELEVAVAAPLQERPDRHDVDIRYGSGELGAPDGRPRLRLFEDRWVVLAAPACVQAQGLATPADLLRAERLRSPLVGWSAWWQAAGLAEGLAEPQRGPVFSDLGILLEAAASGLGVALCSERLSRRWVAEGRLQQLFDLAVPAERIAVDTK